MTIFGVQDDRILWGRLFMDEVDRSRREVSIRQVRGNNHERLSERAQPRERGGHDRER